MFEKMSQEYKCDGLVIELNDAKVRKELGRLPNMNPRYSIAYKNPEWSERADTKVVDIEWKISKDKRLSQLLSSILLIYVELLYVVRLGIMLNIFVITISAKVLW